MSIPTTAPLSDNAEQRLATLGEYALLDSPSEALFNSLAGLAARLCATPISMIAFVDRDRQLFRASVGLNGLSETVCESAFCAQAISGNGIIEIPDALLDARFVDDPLVRNDPYIRFYAAAPLTVAGGHTLGTLCVIDREPRTLSAEQRGALSSISAAVVEQFEFRRAQLRLLDNSSAEFYEIDTHTQRLRLVSDATRRKLGYTLDEAQALLLVDVMPAFAGTGEFARCLEDLRGGTIAPAVRTTVQNKAGTVYPIDLRLELLTREENQFVLALGVDASESAAWNERCDMLSAAIDSAQDAIMIATPGNGIDDGGTIVYANETLLRETAATRADVVGRPADTFFGPKTDRSAIARMRDKLQHAQTVRMQYVAYRRDGSEYHCETVARALTGMNGEVTHFVYVQRDVSDAVAREIALEVLNERLTTLTAVARNLFSSLDPRALVESLIRGVAELTGGGTAQVLARGTEAEFIETRDLLSKAETAVANDDFLRCVAAHDGVLLSEEGQRAGVPILAPSGIVAYIIDIRAGERPFVATDAFAFGLLGQYIAVAVRNVELYGELASRRAAVIELNQVKNDLIAMLAHDFKGPLTTIVGLADVLAEDERFDAESRQFLGMINSSAMRLASLATDTLALSRLEQNELSLRFDRVDMVALLRDIVRVFSVTRVIDMRSSAEVAVVRADAARLRQVFENLIGNAIKYSLRGETVDVILREKRGGVEVAIRDRGIGIPAGDLSKLFGRFARGSNAREMGIGGTGFGLYLSRTIIEMHGGQITLESKEGHGSTFRVFVPTVPAPQRTLDRRVLLLDSEDDGRSFIAHTLRDEGYAVYCVVNEDELLRALDDGRYDAAIVDVDRLVLSAAELVRRIAHRTTLVRLVSTAAAEATGWNAALRKPFLIKDLQVVLESAVAERRRSPRRHAPKEQY